LIITYIGNFIDFLEFGLFTALLPFISKDLLGHYQPNVKADLCYLAAFAGFLGRPVGAFILGKLGDIYGSQRLLVASVLGISLVSLVLAFLPSDSSRIIEMIIICRFFQGVFTGAEYSAVVVSSTSNTTINGGYRSVAIMTASGVLGVSCAQFIAYLLSNFDRNVVGWRGAFVFVSLIAIFTFIKRAYNFGKIPMPPAEVVKSKLKLKNYIKEILMCMLLVGFANSMFYFVNMFLNTYHMILDSKIEVDKFLINFVCTSFFAVCIIAWSMFLSKRNYDPIKMMKIAIFCIFILLFPLLYTFAEQKILLALVVQILFATAIQLFTVVGISYMPRLFPESIRVQSCGLSFNLGISLLGGGFPYICTRLTETTGHSYAPILASSVLLGLAYFTLCIIVRKKTVPAFGKLDYN